jgi:uncharacterized protein
MRTFAFSLLAMACWAAPSGDPRLVEAVKAGNRTQALSLLQQKAAANSAEADGTTALHYAVRNDDTDLTDRLIKAGADVRATNRYGVTPLYLACVNGNPSMIGRLIEAGADPNAAVNEGETALMTTARTGKVQAAKVLLDHGAKVDAREGWHGETALMWAVAQGQAEMAKVLIAAGADVGARSNLNKWERQNTMEPREKWLPLGNFTPLLFAAREGQLEAVKVLAEAGADLNAVDADGISPMLIAIINGHYDVAAFLVNRGADPNLADKTGRTALFSAVDFNTVPVSNRPAPKTIGNQVSSLELIKLLIAKGADVNAQLKTQQPYRAKLDRGTDTMFTTGTTPLVRAAKAADLDAMKVLLSAKADPKLATKNGITPLMAAAGVGTKEEDTTGRFKTEAQSIEAIEMLKGVSDINGFDNRGTTAIHAAAQHGWNKLVRYLAENGARLDLKDRRGFTPEEYAMGKAGGAGFDGQAGDVHLDTAALIRELIQSKAAASAK